MVSVSQLEVLTEESCRIGSPCASNEKSSHLVGAASLLSGAVFLIETVRLLMADEIPTEMIWLRLLCFCATVGLGVIISGRLLWPAFSFINQRMGLIAGSLGPVFLSIVLSAPVLMLFFLTVNQIGIMTLIIFLATLIQILFVYAIAKRKQWFLFKNTLMALLSSGAVIAAMTMDETISRVSGEMLNVQGLFFMTMSFLSLVLCGTVESFSARFTRGYSLTVLSGILAASGFYIACYLIERFPVFLVSARILVLLTAGVLVVVSISILRIRISSLISFKVMVVGAVFQFLFFLILPSPALSEQWLISRSTLFFKNAIISEGKRKKDLEIKLNEIRASREYQHSVSQDRTARAWNATSNAPHPSPDNILLITVDALRWDMLSYTGKAKRVITENLDGFTKGAYNFTNAYSAGGITSISLPTILWSRSAGSMRLTSLYEDNELGMWLSRDQLPKGRRILRVFQSPLKQPTPNLAETLQTMGYTSYAILNDEQSAYFNSGVGFARGFSQQLLIDEESVRRNHYKNQRDDEIVSDRIIDIFASKMSEKKFIWGHFFAPHDEYLSFDGAPENLTLYEMEVYYVDQLIGKVLNQLSAMSLDETTLIVITGDHGESFNEHGKNFHGNDLFDESMKVPLMIRAPGQKEAKTFEVPVSLMDIAPTVLVSVGVKIPEPFQGYSLWPVMMGTENRRPPVYMQTWRINERTERRVFDLYGVRRNNFKLIYSETDKSYMMFDLKKDPLEKNDLMFEMNKSNERVFEQLQGWLWGWVDGFTHAY